MGAPTQGVRVLTESQREWLRVREYLQQHRDDLGQVAAEEDNGQQHRTWTVSISKDPTTRGTRGITEVVEQKEVTLPPQRRSSKSATSCLSPLFVG
jgi:hypothetical protein